MKTTFLFIGLIILFSSCMEKGNVKVQNKVQNVRLENISWGDISISSSLLPGETSEEYLVRDKKEEFPMNHQLEFYMSSGQKKVYLKSKSYYQLNPDETLTIVITDTTEVLNPLL